MDNISKQNIRNSFNSAIIKIDTEFQIVNMAALGSNYKSCLQ